MAHSFLAFAAFAAVVTVTPGLDTMLVLRTAALSGRVAGLAAVAGIVTGCLVWAALSALGVTALLAASRLAFEIVRVAGVAYLIWLGGRALWRSRHASAGLGSAASASGVSGGSAASASAASPVGHSALRAARIGLTTNLLNPKVGLFYLSVMPAFLPAGLPPLAGALSLAAIHAVEGIIWLTILVLLVRRARALLSRPAVARRLEQLTGLVFVGFGLRLALERAPTA